ncbi:DNA-directed RNA polymerase, mitochondrial [Varanus komodoensis]|nr:DNA-directed RNA polymerase, mitochondrial [Varanus komodoensis]
MGEQASKPAREQASKPAREQASKLQNDAQVAEVRDPSAEKCPAGLPQGSPAPGDLQKHVVSLQKAPAETAGRYRNAQLTLLAYLDACIFLKQLDRAQQCLMFYHRSLKRQKQLDIHAYNLLLHAYAKQGSLHEVCFVFSLLEQAGLEPNRDSYIAALSCMGRSDAATFITSRCLKQLEESHICLEDLFRDSVLEDDEVEMALKAIRKVKPDFSPSLPHYLHETCTIPLIQNFYTKKNDVSYPKLNFTVQELQEKFQKQLAMESSDTVAIDSVEAGKPVTNYVVQARKQLATLRSQWQASLLQSLWKSKLHIGQRKSGPNLLPFLCLLEDKVYVDILVQAASQIPPQGESLTTFARDLGTKVFNKYTLQKKSRSRVVEKMQQVYKGYVQLLAKDSKPDNLLPREYWEQLATEAGCSPSLFKQELPWPHSLLVQVGLHLVELLVQELKMQSNLLSPGLEQRLIPVLYHVYSFRSGRQIGFIKPHPMLTRLLLNAAETTLTFDSYVIPTLCPPVPWVSPHFGAYILSSTRLMRSVEEAAQHQLLLEQVPRSDLFPVMDALNQLGNCPWRINGAILDVIVSLFNDKGDEKLGVPPPPSEAPQPLRCLPDGKPLGQLALKREMARCHKKAMEMHSLRMNGLYKLSIAQHMRGQTFWFPHNMDFRGRTYPCPPHLNHLGSDLSRAILSFAEGKPLGPHGLNWLKIHLINLTGLKKKNSLQDRLCYADEIMDDILDSADRPLAVSPRWRCPEHCSGRGV